MILPLSDSPNPRGVPFITYAIIAANVAVYLLISLPLSSVPADRNDPLFEQYVQVLSSQSIPRAALQQLLQHLTQYDLFVFAHGFRPAAPSLVDLLFSIFLHAGFLHLFGNMLFLWIYGDNVEHRLGRLRYLFWYMLTGIAATLFHSAFFRASQLPLVGASGAISGVLGFYFLWFPHNQVRLLMLIVPFFMRVVSLSARLVLGFYLFVDNVLPFLLTRGSESAGVAFGAHIGGFLTGLATAWWLDRRELAAPPPERVEKIPAAGAAGVIRDALAAGNVDQAARLYLGLDPRHTRQLLEPQELLRLGDRLAASGHPRAALAVYLRHLRDYPSGPSAAAAHVGAGLVQLDQLDDVAAAYQHLLDGLDLDPPSDVEARARAALRRIAGQQKFRVGHGG